MGRWGGKACDFLSEFTLKSSILVLDDMVYFSANWITRIFTSVQLKTLLILPFVLQTVGVVTLVGYLSYRSGQQ